MNIREFRSDTQSEGPGSTRSDLQILHAAFSKAVSLDMIQHSIS